MITQSIKDLTALLIVLNRGWLRATLAGRHADAQKIVNQEQSIRQQIAQLVSANNK